MNRATGPRTRQRGAALLVLLTLLVLAASYVLLKRLNADTSLIARGVDSAEVLGQARAALLGYALGSTSQPGALPCPDYSLDGRSDACLESAGQVTIGRLPWLTLGLPDLRDAAGEQLWYAPALELDGNQPINSESPAALRINYGTDAIAAVIIAPGAVVATQSRPPNPAAQIDPARYLEDANRVADVNYVTRPAVAANPFNDQLASIGRDELMQAVERRVLRELAAHLQDYFNLNDYYPYPAPLGASDCDNSLLQGQLPVQISAPCPPLADWPGTGLPGWFTAQGWQGLIWYAPAPACTQTGPGCSAAGGFITVLPDPASDKRALLAAAGPELATQDRSLPSVTQYLEGANNDGDGVFQLLPIDASSNDQLQVVLP